MEFLAGAAIAIVLILGMIKLLDGGKHKGHVTWYSNEVNSKQTAKEAEDEQYY